MTKEIKTRPWREVRDEALAKLTPEQRKEHDETVARIQKQDKFVLKFHDKWDQFLERFFDTVEKERDKADMTTNEVYEALESHYGSVVSEAWIDWLDEDGL